MAVAVNAVDAPTASAGMVNVLIVWAVVGVGAGAGVTVAVDDPPPPPPHADNNKGVVVTMAMSDVFITVFIMLSWSLVPVLLCY